MGKIKTDLHMHGPIGFQPYWLKVQGYAGKNLLKLMTDKAIERGIKISAVTAHCEDVRAFSVDDRLGVLIKYEAPLLSKEYSAGTLGGKNNILVVQKNEERVYFVNGQTVMPKENGKTYDMLIVGTNRLQSGGSFSDTLSSAEDSGLIKIAEHPYVESHRGMGKELLEKYAFRFDAIEGHNSQAVFSNWITKIPKIGKVLSRAGRELNEKAKQTAREFGKPYVATSDAHRIEDLGLSYIELVGKIDDSSEEKFIDYLRSSIVRGDFKTTENYENIFDWFSWVMKFQKGIKSGKVIDEYLCSEELIEKEPTCHKQ